MKINHPTILKIVGVLGAWIVRILLATVRTHIDFPASGEHPKSVKKQRVIFCFWHEAILFGTRFRTKVQVLISLHRDGEWIARICDYLRYTTARGSSGRKGAIQAIRQMIAASKHSNLAVTPDGPRGPRRKVQLGVILLASKTGLPILMCGIHFSNAWRARTWDRFIVPIPFSSAYAVVPELFYVPSNLNEDQLEFYRDLLEKQMLQATDEAERRAKGLPKQALFNFSPTPNGVTLKTVDDQREIPEITEESHHFMEKSA